MQPAAYSCQACGHTFTADPEVVSRQPTCPKCRTFGKLVAAAKPQLPRALRPASREPAVEVAAGAVYGRRGNPKSVITGVVIVLLGLGSVIVLYFIVTGLTGDSAEIAKQKKEVVLDKKEFSRAVDKAVEQARSLVAGVEGVEIRETTDFSQAMAAIEEAGGTVPGWTQALRPGTPFKAFGFEVSAPDKRTGQMVTGFMMLLYYTTAQEVSAAHAEIDREVRPHTHFSTHVSQPMWFVAYGGASYGGELYDKIKNAMARAQPSSFKQFTDRVGSTWNE